MDQKAELRDGWVVLLETCLEPGPSRARYFPRDMLLLTTTARELVVNSNL